MHCLHVAGTTVLVCGTVVQCCPECEGTRSSLGLVKAGHRTDISSRVMPFRLAKPAHPSTFRRLGRSSE